MKVAILIPTKNRPDFIERTVAYYASVQSPHPLYIGDASGSDVAGRIVAFLNRIVRVEVKYFHWENLGINQTITKLAEIAQTECQYCSLHGDDDYFIPSALDRCADFLSENPSYRTVQGRAALFTLDRPGPYGKIQSIGEYWGVNALEQETSADRFTVFANKYFVLQFSTHRTNEFLQDCQEYAKVGEEHFGELVHCFTFAIKGKSKFIDCLYLVRNVHSGIYHPTFVDWCTKKNWSSEYHKAIAALSCILQEASSLSQENACQMVSSIFRKRIEQQIKSKSISNKVDLSVKLRSFLPVRLKKTTRRLLDLVQNNTHAMRLLQSRSSCFYKEFLPVENSLTKRCSINLPVI